MDEHEVPCCGMETPLMWPALKDPVGCKDGIIDNARFNTPFDRICLCWSFVGGTLPIFCNTER